MKRNFAAIILRGTGQVGGAAVAELLTIPECREVVMVTRKPIGRDRGCAALFLIQALLNSPERTAAVAREVLSQGR